MRGCCWPGSRRSRLGHSPRPSWPAGSKPSRQLGSIQALFDTAYGRVLLVKMALVALMLPLSAMAWRLKRPHVRVEAALAAGVVAAAGSALARSRRHRRRPPAQVAEDAAATPTAGLPSGDELTMAGAAGQRPGRPEPVTGIARPQPRHRLSAPGRRDCRGAGTRREHRVNGVYKALLPCGDTCRRATIDIEPGDAVSVEVLEQRVGGEGRVHDPVAARTVRRQLACEGRDRHERPDRLPVQRGPQLGH